MVDNTSCQSKITCGDCFSWNTRDCKKWNPNYPNMPIWNRSIPCDKYLSSHTTKKPFPRDEDWEEGTTN